LGSNFRADFTGYFRTVENLCGHRTSLWRTVN